MLALYLIARMLYRQRYSLNSIGTAALVLLVIWPRSLFDPSFQLTFLAVAALGGMVQPLLERTLLPYSQALRGINLLGYDTALEPKLAQLRLDVRLIAVKLGVVMGLSKEFCAKALSFAMRGTITFLELVIVTAAMQVALALPMVWYFHRLSAVGVPANIAIVPLTTLLMPLAIVASLLAFAGATAAKVLAVPTALLLHAVTATTGWLSHAHRAHFRVASPVVPVAIACAGIFLLSLFAFKRSRASAWAATISLLFAAVLLVVPRAPDYRAGALEITAVDVGQGDSLLLVEPHGGTLLIDGGGPPGFVQRNSFDVGEDVVSPYLWSRGFSRIDAVVLTHAHSDHMDGLRSVIANFKPREIWLAGEVPAALAEIARANGVAVRQLHAGDTIKFGAADFGVLAAGASGDNVNDTSVVLHVSYGESSALLLGDAEKELEKRIATDMRRVDVMKVAHHGSATSTTPELLKNARPHYAVISVGAQNPYRHPRAEVIERLRTSGTVTYRTDVNGATTFYLDGERVLADSYLLAPPIAPERPGPRQAGSRGTPR
jgi:competence protein ComEC